MSFRMFIMPWVIAAAVICVIEGAIFAAYRPTIIERSDFIVQPIQSFLRVRAERWIIWNKLRRLPARTPFAVQAGDSSGFYGIIPDVVSEYVGGQMLLNLSCCANQGFHGYLVMLEVALQRYRSLRFAVVYVSPTVTLDDSQWAFSPPDVVLAPGNFLPMMSAAMRDNFIGFRKYIYPPSNALRPQIYEKVLLPTLHPPQRPQDREPNEVFERAGGMFARDGYMIEHDLQADVPGGCVPIRAPHDPWTGKTYWELFAAEFVTLAKRYAVTPVIIFGPTSFAACDLNKDFRNEIARLRIAFPALKIPYDPIETWPSNFFSVPAHVQHNLALEASRRVGRALRALENGRERAEDLAAGEPSGSEPTMHIIGATLTEECGWNPDYRNGYYADISEAVSTACDGKSMCAYKEGSDPRDQPPRNAGCKGVYVIDYQCQGESVRSLRQEGRQLFGGNFRLDCRSTHYLAKDPMPLGIQIAYATFESSSGGVIGNATTPIADWCQGRLECKFAVDVTKLGGKPTDAAKTLQIVYRCGHELASRVTTIANAENGTSVRLGCAQAAAPAPHDPIAIVNATYGGECGAALGNADYLLKTLCEGKDSCKLPRLGRELGADAPACARNLRVAYRCGSSPQLQTALQADGQVSVALACPAH